MTELPDLTAVELVAQYRAKTLSPVEVTEAVLARIEAREPELHALYAYDPSAARDDAKASEARWQAGEPLGPIDGVPLTLKENIATRGTPVPLGTAATALTPAAEDAPAAARVRESGGVLLAKTTMPDYGMLTSGLSSFHPTARNPWRPRRRRAARARVRARRPRRATARCTSARTSAARSGCPRAGAAWSG